MTNTNELIETELAKGRTKGAKDKKKRKSLKDRIKSAFSPKEKAKQDILTPPKDVDIQLRALKRAQKRGRR